MLELQEQIKKFLILSPVDGYGYVSLLKDFSIPDEFHPRNVLTSAQAVIVYVINLPERNYGENDSEAYNSDFEYTTARLDDVSDKLTALIKSFGFSAFPVYADEEILPGRGIISLGHFAALAGIGVLGKNRLLITKQWGNMCGIGAVITDIPLPQSKRLNTELCIKGCSVCLDSCPANAFMQGGFFPEKCGEYGNEDKMKCFLCRIRCPLNSIKDDKTENTFTKELAGEIK